MTHAARESILRLFRRHTSSGKYLAEIDGLRFFSIAMVVVYHVSENLASFRADAGQGWFHDVAALGRFGPHLFFVISGFVLALPFAQARAGSAASVRLPQYYLRRLTRIEPPFVIAMTIIFAGFLLLRDRAFSDLLPQYASGLLYLNHWIGHGDNPFVPVSWSLEVEVQFYIVAPLLAAVFLVRSHSARIGILFALAATALLVRPVRVGIPPFLHYYLELFAAGFVAAHIYVHRWNERPRMHRIWDAVGAAALAGLALSWMHPERLSSQAAFPLLAIALFCAAFAGPWTNAIVTNRVLATIGGMCYTIYLIHFPVINSVSRTIRPLTERASLDTAVLVSLAVQTLAILTASTAFFILFERPFMRVLWPREAAATIRRLLLRGRGVAVTPPDTMTRPLASSAPEEMRG